MTAYPGSKHASLFRYAYKTDEHLLPQYELTRSGLNRFRGEIPVGIVIRPDPNRRNGVAREENLHIYIGRPSPVPVINMQKSVNARDIKDDE